MPSIRIADPGSTTGSPAFETVHERDGQIQQLAAIQAIKTLFHAVKV